MDISFLKNPIILTVIAMVLTYLYLYWQMTDRQSKNPKATIETPGYTIPIGVGVFTFIITYSLFGFPKGDTIENANVLNIESKPVLPLNTIKALGGKLLENKSNISEKLTDGFDSNTYHLVGRNSIKLPQTDVFIDLAKF